MISRVTMARSGLVDYLITGKVKESDLTREDKDEVTTLFGNINKLKEAEIYTNKFKKWKNNYEHLTVSFNAEDEKRLNELSEEDKNKVLKEISEIYIKHRTSGYDINNEIIAYAEYHNPKIKTNDKGKARLPHIHIAISYLNALSDTQIKTTFYNNSFISDVLDKFVSKKYNLTFADRQNEFRDKNFRTQEAVLRSEWIYRLSNLKNEEELLKYFQENNFKENEDYRLVKTKRNRYYKLIEKGITYKKGEEISIDINLTGKGFERFSNESNEKIFNDLKYKELLELQTILIDYYNDRVNLIGKRRSKETTKKLEDIYQINDETEKAIENLNINTKIFTKHFDYLQHSKFDDYKVNFLDNKKVLIQNLEEDIKIIDDDIKIISESNSTNLEKEINLMIDICLAKEWKLEELKVSNTDDDFSKTAKRIIAEKLQEKQNKNFLLQEQKKEKIKSIENIKHSEIASYLKELENKISRNELDNSFIPEVIKKELRAESVLEFCLDKFLIKIDNYEITSDNKINNKMNKQKPKNVIDFFCTEINLSSREAFTICKELLSLQNLNIKDNKIKTNEHNNNKTETSYYFASKKTSLEDSKVIQRALYYRDLQAKEESKKEDIIYALNNGENVFLTGGAGVGKSFLTRQIIEEFENNNKIVAKLGSTGIAAQNINGKTMHSFFGFGKSECIEHLEKQDKKLDDDYLFKKLEKIGQSDLIVIDEISMISDKQLAMIHYRLEQSNFKGKILFVGDYQQLSPIKGNYAFASPIWEKLNIKTHALNVIKRNDNKDFSELLNRMRYGNVSDEDDLYLKNCENKIIDNQLDYTYIFPTNKEVNKHNDEMISNLVKNGSQKYDIETFTDIDISNLNKEEKEIFFKQSPFNEKLELADNCKILFTVNDSSLGVSNGQRGVFQGFDEEDNAKILLDNNTIVLLPKRTVEEEVVFNDKILKTVFSNYPIKLAYAITVHKSQGMSIENLAVSPNRHFADNQFYVAISRSKNPEKLVLLQRDDYLQHYEQAVKTDTQVLSFYHPELKKEFNLVDKKEPLGVNLSNQNKKSKGKKNGKENNVREHERNESFYESIDREIIRRREATDSNNMRTLSSRNLDAVERIEMLLQSNTLDIIRYRDEEKSNKTLQSTDDNHSKTFRRIALSTTEDNANFLNKWKQIILNSENELEEFLKDRPYSTANFKKGYRNSDNIESFNNMLIFDIDNNKYSKKISIKEVEDLFKKHDIQAYIIPTKNNNELKKVSYTNQKNASKKEKEEYHKAERFRIIVPTNKPLDKDISKEEYIEFQNLISKSLKIHEYVDKSSLYDKSRFYYPSGSKAKIKVINSNNILKIDNYLNTAKEKYFEQINLKKEDFKNIEKAKKNEKEYQKISNETNSLFYVDTQKIMSLNIENLIEEFETIKETTNENNFKIIKTNNLKYAIISNNLVYNFKTKLVENNISYLKNHLKTNSLYKVADDLKIRKNEDFLVLNKEIVENEIKRTLNSSNNKDFEHNLKTNLKTKAIKVENDNVFIANEKFKIREFKNTKQMQH